MNRRLYLSVVTVLVILCGCSQNPVEIPNPIETPDPVETPSGSALGDSPTITGNISNLSDANLGGTSLTVKAELGSDPGTGVIAEGDVAANGDFSIKLPGIATLEDDLFERDYVGICASDTLTVTPDMHRAVNLGRFRLYSNNQHVEELLYAKGPRLESLVEYIFSDRDIKIQGPCDGALGLIIYDVEMKKGWNTLILDPSPDRQSLRFRTAVPDSSFEWLLPRVPSAVLQR